MDFIPVITQEALADLAVVAHDIWHEYWPDHIGLEQTSYMVERFQSEEVLTHDIQDKGYVYWLLQSEGRTVGYTGGKIEEETERFFLSKLYLYAEERGKGFASEAIRFYELFCRENGLKSMYLTVNKGNELAMRAYLGKGFEVIDAVETDIGGGFIMDDFIMEKVV